MPSLSPAYPAFSLFSCPLSPRPPSPPGKGEIFSFLMQGASPLASPGLNPGGTGAGGVSRAGGGVPSESPTCRKTDRTAILLAVPAAKERGDRGRWNYPSHATAAFEMVLSPGAGRTNAARGAVPCPPVGRHRSRGRIARWRRGLPCLAGSAGVSGTRLRRGGFGRRLDLPEPSLAGGGAGKYAKGGVGRRQRGKTSSPVAAPCKKIFKSP